MRKFYTYKQGEHEDLSTYLQQYKDVVQTIEQFGGNVFMNDVMIKYEKENDKETGAKILSEDKYSQRVRNKYLATCFLKRSK